MIKYTLIIFCLISFNLNAKEIAISFDDAPRRLTSKLTNIQRAKEIVKKLKKANVKDAAFFCNSAHINEKTKGALKVYADAGFKIANHTHSHPSFSKLNFKEYKADFLEADTILKEYSTFTKLFRFPYLREGNKKKKRNKMRKFLTSMGYTNAYITVDFSDWHLEDLYRQSLEKGEKVNLKRLKKLYLSLTKESLEHYDSLANKYLNRSPKHVLLLHETDLAALFIDDLVKAMRSWGWKIISSKEAYTDPIADFKLKKAIKYNPGRIGEIALSKGHPIKEIWAPSTSTSTISKRYEYEVLKN